MRQRIPEVAALVLAVTLALAVGLGTRYVNQADWVRHSLEVESKISRIWSLLQDAEIGQRGFVLTGDDRFLAPFVGADKQIAAELDALIPLVSDNPSRVAAIAEARPLITERLALADNTIAVRRRGDVKLALTHVLAGRGLAVMEDLRGRFERMQQEEARLLDVRSTVAQRTILILSAAIVLALIAASYVLTSWIVDARRSSRELARTNAILRETIAEREAAELQMRQMQKMEAIGQLAGGIAHDFNNMLAVIISAVSLAQRRLSSGEPGAEKLLASAFDGARRAANLVSRLLAFSRQQPLAPEPIDANKFVAGISEMIARSLGAAIRMETVLGAGLWTTHADPAQLETSILNLSVNARDAMPEGGRLTLETANCHLDDRYCRLHPGVRAGQYIMIAVTDTGIGMSADVIAKAFDPFFTTKDWGKGTGLGLSQVFGFVKQSGGHVQIYSEPGQGTTVKIYLPRYYGQAADRPAASAPAELRGTETILLVEDDATVLSLTASGLRDLGYTVLEARHASDAIALLDGGQCIDLLLTDIIMPNIDGGKLAEQAVKLSPNLKVLYMTGFTKNAVVHNGVLDPGVHFLAKPFTLEELSLKVREALETKG